MQLPNIFFKDFPIEYKTIDESDFNSEDIKSFEVKPKIIIEQDENGYIYEALKDKISLERKETLIINASVGCGKSYSILKLIAKINKEDHNAMIIVATPFVSLIYQYVNDIVEKSEIPREFVYDYSDLGRNSKIGYAGMKVHVVTVNTLLGNPGDDGFKNSDAKRKYLKEIIQECKDLKKKVFFIFDEIHDSVQNFKEKYIFNLWNWREVIHKNIVISATYTEASKVVIMYLAELTENKIAIIEVKRKRFVEKQSELFLHYCSDYNFSVTTNKIVYVVEDLLNKGKNIDILSYSKKLAVSIIKDKVGIGKKLSARFSDINNCTSELFANQRGKNSPPTNRYDNTKCNIGTNFKSGVNIEKENHALLIILPSRSSRLQFRNMSGVFSDGIVGIIQALARQRIKGEIHLILPKPDLFNYESLKLTSMTKFQVEKFEKSYSEIASFDKDTDAVEYIPLASQDSCLSKFYEILLTEVKDSVKFIQNEEKTGNRIGLPHLTFPTYDSFKIETGEDFLANYYKFFGGDLASYVTYCAFTNQFVNCNLIYINSKETIYFKVGEIQQGLLSSFNSHFGFDFYDSITTYSNFKMFFERVRNDYVENYTLKLIDDAGKKINIKSFNNPEFEIQLLQFCYKIYQSSSLLNSDKLIVDDLYSRSDYFLNCIAYSEENKNENKLTSAYSFIGELRKRLINEIVTTKSGVKCIPVKPTKNFINATEMLKFHNVVEVICRQDPFLNKEIFKFKRNLKDKDSSSQLTTLYKILIEDFLIIDNSKSNYGKIQIEEIRVNVKPVISIKELPLNNGMSTVMTNDLDKTYQTALTEHVTNIKTQDGKKMYKSLQDYFDRVNLIFKNE